jgi:hypothetical protein
MVPQYSGLSRYIDYASNLRISPFLKFAMIKTTLAFAAAAALAPAGAIAGPYANVEANSGFSGSSYAGTVTDVHLGYEGNIGESASWYAQGGAGIITINNGPTETVPTGKVGLGVNASENLNLYGEISFAGGVDGAETSYGTKVGVKYSF